MTSRLLAEQIINGLILGSMYALMASGLSLIWGSLKMVNFAHGEFFMLGGYIMYSLYVQMQIPLFLAIVFTVLTVMICGYLINKLYFSRLIKKPGWDVSSSISTLGLSILLQNLAMKLWGERFKNIPYFSNELVMIGDIQISKHRLIILLVATSVIAIGIFCLKKTRLGKAIRATAHDPTMASLMGVNIDSISSMTIIIGVGLASLAAILLAPISSVNPWMGQTLLLKAFVVAVIGGLGNLAGAIVIGILLGTIESFTVILWSSEWQDVVGFGILMLVIWIRPYRHM